MKSICPYLSWVFQLIHCLYYGVHRLPWGWWYRPFFFSSAFLFVLFPLRCNKLAALSRQPQSYKHRPNRPNHSLLAKAFRNAICNRPYCLSCQIVRLLLGLYCTKHNWNSEDDTPNPSLASPIHWPKCPNDTGHIVSPQTTYNGQTRRKKTY